MILTDHVPPRLPSALEGSLSTRLPLEQDVPAVVALLEADDRSHTPDASVEAAGVRSRLVGLKSWSRRQLVVVPATAEGPSPEAPVAWVSVEDRATGRSDVEWVAAPDLPARDELVAALLGWAEEVAGSFARHRGVQTTQLDASANALDADRRRLLTADGFTQVRDWLHMRRPVTLGEAADLPEPRPGTRVRPVHRHPSGLPVAQDVRTVHRMLEESFADHWGSYRESFAEFVQRLIENPEQARWDHWWIAEIEREGRWLPAGGLVAAPIPARADAAGLAHDPARGEGTYLEYLGVHRSARGHGIAKSLLRAAIRDAAERGRTRVELEVDAASPTGADGLYAAMGWEPFERTESWQRTVTAHPSRLLEPPPA